MKVEMDKGKENSRFGEPPSVSQVPPPMSTPETEVRVTHCSKTTSFSKTSSFRGTGPSSLTPTLTPLTSLRLRLHTLPLPIPKPLPPPSSKNIAPLHTLHPPNADTAKFMANGYETKPSLSIYKIKTPT
uniref:Uncharacterized protein n=1 Tax=Glycine max TaxID=3847 RepID=A0A0R0LDM5_SOYBN